MRVIGWQQLENASGLRLGLRAVDWIVDKKPDASSVRQAFLRLLRQSDVFAHGHFFCPALQVEHAAKLPLFQPFPQ